MRDRGPPRGTAGTETSYYLATQPLRVTLTLYQLDGCPFCEKVADALDDHGIDYETIWVEAAHSERDEVKRVSGQRGVPVLVDEDRGVTMAESENILEYVEQTLAPAAAA